MKRFKGFIETLLIISFLTVVFFAKNAQGYDRLGNMSTRGNVVAGQGGAMITGFIADGTGSGN